MLIKPFINITLTLLLVFAVNSHSYADGGYPDAVANARNSVVKIYVEFTHGKKQQRGAMHGTGFVIAPGKVITNAHVAKPDAFLDGISAVDVYIVDGGIFDGKLKTVNTVEYDFGRDLAILYADTLSDRPALPLATPQDDGKSIYSMGFPGVAEKESWNISTLAAENLSGAMSSEKKQAIEKDMTTPAIKRGEISRMVEVQDWSGVKAALATATPVKVIQHSATIEKGNSGGPIINGCGAVVGVNSQAERTNYEAVDTRELIAFLTVKNVAYQPQETACGATSATAAATESEASFPLWLWAGIGLVALAMSGFALLFWNKKRLRPIPAPPSVAAATYYLQGLQELGQVRIPLHGSQVSIGYDADLNAYAIPDRTVSRQHASLLHNDGQWQLLALRTLNPTTLNGDVVDANDSRPLKVGDIVTFGDATFTVSQG